MAEDDGLAEAARVGATVAPESASSTAMSEAIPSRRAAIADSMAEYPLVPAKTIVRDPGPWLEVRRVEMRTLLKLAAVLALVTATASAPYAARFTAPTMVGPSFSSIGPLAFNPDGVLYAADRQAATIFALDLGTQATAGAPGTQSLAAINQKIAALFGTDAQQIAITDLAVHPKSHNSYLSVMRGQGPSAQAALVKVDGAGALSVVSLDTVKYTSVELPNAPAAATTGRSNRMQSITDMAFLDGRLYVTGLSNEEFSSKFWALPYPFGAADRGTSVEIWHGSHARFETNAPVLTFVPTRVANQPTLIAGYTCTPLVRFPVSDLKPGAKVMGTTISELGAGNQPIDMVLYNKDGHQYLLMANTRHGVLKIATDTFGTQQGLKDPVPGTAGVPAEKVTSLTNVVQLDLLDATHSVVLRNESGTMNLEAVILP